MNLMEWLQLLIHDRVPPLVFRILITQLLTPSKVLVLHFRYEFYRVECPGTSPTMVQELKLASKFYFNSM